MTFITLEIDAETGEAETWVAHSRSSFTARVNRRLREMVEAGALAVGGHYKDPLEGLEVMSEAGLEIMVFDQLHAIAHVRSKGAHHWAVYEALRDHGLIHPPFIVSWYDCPPEVRATRLLVNEASAEVWNQLEAERVADHRLSEGCSDVRLAEHDMCGDLIRERAPPFHP